MYLSTTQALPTFVPLGSELLVNTHRASDQFAPKIAMRPNREFVIVWQDQNGTGGSNADIFGQRFNSLGQKVGDSFQVNTYTAGPQQEPEIAMNALGNFVVACGGSTKTAAAPGFCSAF